MRALIISDTHGDARALEHILQHVGAIDTLIHAGDVLAGESDGSRRIVKILNAIPQLFMVHGNCDSVRQAAELGLNLQLETNIFSFNNRLVLLHHGHRYRLVEMMEKARTIEGTVIITGHTHVKELFEQDGLVVVNPGSPSRPRDGVASYAIWDEDAITLYDLLNGQAIARLDLN